MASGGPGYASFLNYVLVGDTRERHPKVVTIPETATAEEALKLLAKQKILSAPVVRTGGNPNDWQDVLGIVNQVDIVTRVCFERVFSRYNTDAKVEDLTEDVFLATQHPRMFNEPVVELLGISRESQTHWVFHSEDVMERLMAVFSGGVHRVLLRVPLGNGEEQLTIYSQSDVARFLLRHSKSAVLKEIMELPVANPKTIKRYDTDEKNYPPIVTLSDKSTALTGFRRMVLKKEISALPVVNEEGVLVDTLSLSDLRSVNKDGFKYVLLPVREFLRVARDRMRDPVCVKRDTPLRVVLERIVHAGVHRAWLVDDQQRPIGAVSLSDIIHLFCELNMSASAEES